MIQHKIIQWEKIPQWKASHLKNAHHRAAGNFCLSHAQNLQASSFSPFPFQVKNSKQVVEHGNW
jgi:hypothetical protein